ncbi:MAG: response regulator [Desulfobacula sp.]|jgi:excisionase family DNA binding protein|nr:response regulator [Desulfobacula sp.]
MEKGLISLPKAAKECSISRWTLWSCVKAGDLKVFRTPGGHYRIAKSDLEAFIDKKGMQPTKKDDFNSKKILIVDDDEQIHKWIKRIFDGIEFKLEFATDGFEAGQKILKFQPHLVILDLFMPKMDGFKVCMQIKEDEDTKNTTVIAISGYDSDDNKKKILGCGADAFISKPLDKNRLKSAVENSFK